MNWLSWVRFFNFTDINFQMHYLPIHMLFLRILFAYLIISAVALPTWAQFSLNSVFGDSMVLQQHVEVPIFGEDKPGAPITVTFGNKNYKTRTDSQGRWIIKLDNQKAGGPYQITIDGSQSTTLKDVYFGDVWVCSGQSNMAWELLSIDSGMTQNRKAHMPKMRLREVKRIILPKKTDDAIFENAWKPAIAKRVGDFSAVGYFFGRYLYNNLNVPIGLIEADWGGTAIESWIPIDTLDTYGLYSDSLQKTIDFYGDDPTKKIEQRNQEIKSWADQYIKDDIGIQEKWYNQKTPGRWKKIQIPGLLKNELPDDFKGTVYFQKEFKLPDGLKNSDLFLRLGRVNQYDQTYINGHLIAETYNNSWRSYFIDKALLNQEGENLLTVRLIALNSEAGLVEPSPQKMNLGLVMYSASEYDLPLAGKWRYRVASEFQVALPPVSKPLKISPHSYPSGLYNAMIHPITHMPIKGVIWYQGESNAYRADSYYSLFPAMIRSWRTAWNNDTLPFVFVQLANFRDEDTVPQDHSWPELREAQYQTLQLPHTNMATAIDLGSAKTIHPLNKKDVGERLGKAALKVAYGQKNTTPGPYPTAFETTMTKIKITFNNVGQGLHVQDAHGYIRGFALAGADSIFYWAKAHKTGKKTVEVYCDNVPNPKYVRYAWSINPGPLDLYNSEGLPVLPFRNDNFPKSTTGRTYFSE